MTAAMSILVNALALGEPLLPEPRDRRGAFTLVAKHPPDSEGAAVGRDRLALADELERGLHDGWKWR